MEKKKKIEGVIITMILLIIVVFAFYHISTEITLGLSREIWHCIWYFSDTALMIIICYLISLKYTGVIKRLFSWPLMLYFAFRGIYYLCCYLNLYLFNIWLWNGIMIAPLLAGLICIFINYEKDN